MGLGLRSMVGALVCTNYSGGLEDSVNYDCRAQYNDGLYGSLFWMERTIGRVFSDSFRKTLRQRTTQPLVRLLDLLLGVFLLIVIGRSLYMKMCEGY